MPGRNAGQKPPNYGLELPGEVYTPEEVRAILRAFSRRGSAGIRNTAITVLLWRCGLRISEALKAPLGDLDLAAGTFFVRYPKRIPKRDRRGRAIPDQYLLRQRLVAIDPEAGALVERWLTRRRAIGIGSRAPLFCQVQEPCRGEPMAAGGYREALKAAAAKAGLQRRAHPHGFRHTFAFGWVQEGRPLNQLSTLLGHSNLAVTARYADHLNPKEALDAQRARPWDGAPPAGLPPELEAGVRQLLERMLAA
jgi:integrase